MNSFLNPLLNPNLGSLSAQDSGFNSDDTNGLEGRMGNMWTHENLIASLNHLIQVCLDGQRGYIQAAEHAKSAWLRGLFQSCSTQREQFATELTNIVASLGAEPISSTSLAGTLHRTWFDLRTAVTGETNDDATLLDECERGEEIAREAYEIELGKGLPEHIHNAVYSQYQNILDAQSQVREMRDAFPH